MLKKVIIVIISMILISPLFIMFAVNTGLTNEKSGIGNIIDLEKIINGFNTGKILKTGSGILDIVDNNRDFKLKFCEKEILTAIDISFDFVKESNVDELFSHVEFLVGNLKPDLSYCLLVNKNGVYSFSKLKDRVIKHIDIKYENNIITDLYGYESYDYIRTFFSGTGAKLYFGDVVKKLNNVTEDELKSLIMVEQIRGSMTNRGFFKQIVKNNVLQSFTDFSLGIGGMKKSTAIEIGNNLKDINSDFYLGKDYENILDNISYNNNLSLEKKLTENKNYYHQYLYTGLAIKMIKSQWLKKGYNLDGKIGIISTVYNLGLKKSKPNNHPGIGGAEINIDGKKWYFGELGEKIWLSLQKYK